MILKSPYFIVAYIFAIITPLCLISMLSELFGGGGRMQMTVSFSLALISYVVIFVCAVLEERAANMRRNRTEGIGEYMQMGVAWCFIASTAIPILYGIGAVLMFVLVSVIQWVRKIKCWVAEVDRLRKEVDELKKRLAK